MTHIIDRRLNPNGKNLANRQKFIRRAHNQIKKAVHDSIQNKNIKDIGQGENVHVPVRDLDEPSFGHDREGGRKTYVHSGNKEYAAGDTIPKPQGGGGKGRKASQDGDGEDDFGFVLTRDEFLDFFFEDMELPDLVKKSLKEILTNKVQRAGYTNVGNPATLDVRMTMRNALGRRIALKRPNKHEIKELEQQLENIKDSSDYEDACEYQRILSQLKSIKGKLKTVPWVDPLDVRYRNFVQKPQPNVQAVMFCIMDVSGSMGEREKDLAKRFFMLLYLFLERKYEKLDLVFIRHTHRAEEVDEHTFFHDRSTGGTVVSVALEKMTEIIKERYPGGEWNIYAAQCSDGDNIDGDSLRCKELLEGKIMPQLQYMAYIEIADKQNVFDFSRQQQGELWDQYNKVKDTWKNFATKIIRDKPDIYPVFRELFSKEQ
jgi:uncharacterized protein